MFKYIIARKHYLEKGTGHKLVIFYVITVALSLIRIVFSAFAMTTDLPPSQLLMILFELFMFDALIRFFQWCSYTLQIDDLKRSLVVMNETHVYKYSDFMFYSKLEDSKRRPHIEGFFYLIFMLASVTPLIISLATISDFTQVGNTASIA